MTYVGFIFGAKVLNYKRYLTFFQFSIYKNIIENSLEDLNCIQVIDPRKIWMNENCNMWRVGDRLQIVHRPGSGCWRLPGIRTSCHVSWAGRKRQGSYSDEVPSCPAMCTRWVGEIK